MKCTTPSREGNERVPGVRENEFLKELISEYKLLCGV